MSEISDNPELKEAIDTCSRLLIEYTKEYENPEIESTITVDDGRVFKLTFERIDLD